MEQFHNFDWLGLHLSVYKDDDDDDDRPTTTAAIAAVGTVTSCHSVCTASEQNAYDVFQHVHRHT